MTLVAVFQWVLYSTVAGSVAAALVLLAKALSRNRFNAHWHYLIWFIVLFRLLVPYSFGNTGLVSAISSAVKTAGIAEHAVLNIILPGTTKQIPVDRPGSLVGDDGTKVNPAENTATSAPAGTAVETAPSTGTAPMPSPFDLSTLALVWLAGVAVTGASILLSYRRLMVKVAREPRCDDPELLAIVKSARTKLGIRAEIPIVLDSTVNGPAFVGLFAPRLLIPADLPAGLSSESKRNIVMHELAHLKRHDILVNWLAAALQTLHWFNPLIWHAFSIMKQDCEVACDATALAHIEPGERRGYGQTIIDLLQILSRPVFIPGTTHIASKTGIKRRMAMIAKSSKKRSPWSIAAVVVTVVVVVGAVAVSGARAFVLNRAKSATPPIVAGNTPQNPGPGSTNPAPTTNGATGGLTAYTRATIAARLASDKKVYDVTWSPDNTMVVFIRDGGQTAPTGYAWKVGDVEAKSIGQVSSVTHGFIWAPDSKHFLISERVGGPSVLATVVDAGTLSRNSVQINSVTQPIWGPDSKSIAAGCIEDQQGTRWTTLRIFTIGQTDSKQLVKLHGDGIPITAKSWTGSTITYTVDNGNGSAVEKTAEVK